MVRPLEKRTAGGERYARLPSVEKAINEARELPWPSLQERLQLRDRSSPDWIPSECLVHLIRLALRKDDEVHFERLLKVLLQRCARSLSRSLASDRVPNAQQVHEEIHSALGELIAHDLVDLNHRLDYFEIRFDSAFARLRSDAVRAEWRRTQGVRSLDAIVAELQDSNAATDTFPFELLRQPSTQEEKTYANQLLTAIYALPPRERDALLYVRIFGYPIESDDPAKTTAATLLSVSPRTIRSRISRAVQRLRKTLETP